MRLRHIIASWLAPDVFESADRHLDLLATIQHEARWLAEFSDIAAALDRLVAKNPIDISRFREQLRADAIRRHVLARRGVFAELAWPVELERIHCDDRVRANPRRDVAPGDHQRPLGQ